MSDEHPVLRPVLNSAETLRHHVMKKVVNTVESVFPIEMKTKTLTLTDVQPLHKEFSPEEQKHALMTGGSLAIPVKGTLTLKDLDGKVLDQAKNFTLMHVPYFTERHTLILDGNEYQVANMLRRKPGVYTQRSANGELTTLFNLSKGKNFYVGMNPEKGTFHLEYGTSKIPLYPVLRALGVPHTDFAKYVGSGVADQNKAVHGHHLESATDKLYKKIVHPALIKPTATHDEKVKAIEGKFDQTAMDGSVSKVTLGTAHNKVTPLALLEATKRLLHTHEGKQDIDDSDSLGFKTFHSVDDFFAERMKLFSRTWLPKAKMRFQGRDKIREAITPQPFTDTLKRFVTTSTLAAVPTGINPIELLDHAVKVTTLGEGGIPNERAVPYETRMLHPTQYGVIDLVRTPECVEKRTEIYTKKGWKFAPDLTGDDELACLIDGTLEFHKPLKITAAPYKGVMYGVNTGKIAYLVTPNHRVYYAQAWNIYPKKAWNANDWRISRADEVHGKNRVFATAHKPYVGHEVEYFDLPKVESRYVDREPSHGGHLHDSLINIDKVKMTDWASFMGWFLAEGAFQYVEDSKQRGTYITRISQSSTANPEKCAAIKALLERMPFGWCYSGGDFCIRGKQLAAYVKQFGFCYDKYIPEYFFDTSVEARTNLLETLMLGDGRIDAHRATGKSYKQEVFCTTSPQLALDVERLAISLGRAVRTRKYQDKREERYLDIYEVRLMQNDLRQAVPGRGHYFTEDYDDMVYCPTVPGGLIYIRREGLVPLWSGNSSHAGVDLRATVAAHRDETGHLYTPVYDVKKKIDTYLQAGDINQRVIAFPHQKLEGTVDAFVKGKVTRVPIEDVQYQFKHYAQTLSPATSLIPFLHSTQGNRSIMGAKMQTQSLPLVEREAPYVQVKSHSSDKSYEHLYGHTILPTAPIDGTVEKIEGGWIHIRPHGSVKKADEYIEHFASPIALPSGWSAIARNHSADKGGVILRRAHPTTGQTMVDKMSHEEFEAHKNGAPWVSTNWDTAGNLKTAEDRPTIERKPLGPFTFNIEIKKGAGHKAEGQTKAKGSSEDYGHLPGYTGPDGDSLDFFVGNDHDGHLFAYDKQKRPDAKSPWKTTDVKFVVGLNKADHDEFVRRTTDWNSATVRFANKRNFRDWDHLKEHIDEHYKDEHKLAADEDEGLVRVPYQDNFPFPSKTYLHHTLDVKPGDKVTKGQRLADSNFTRDGVLALGKNLRVAYMAWHGLNSNDAVVISESCAKKLISEHVYREVYPITHKIELNKNKHHIYYGAQYTPQQYAALDEHGIVKVGAKVSHHDLLVAGLSKAEISGTDLMLGRISKALTKPYREVALHWEHGTQGVVSEVVRTANQIAILVKTQEPMQIGDKLAGRYGNKGVVAEIVPDSQMVRDEGGNVIDVIMTSAGVVSRINPGQIIETAVGKVAHKTGKPIVYNNAAGHDTVQWAKDLLKEHGIKDKETVYDPTRKRYIKGGDGKGVFVGHQFIFKLFKSTETNFSAHGVGPYDINEQPSKKGGEESPKGLAKMEFDALVAHDVRNILNEVSTIRSQKNEEFWKALQLGQPLPVAKPAFVFNKFTALLEGAGVKMHKEGSKIKLLPKTDKDILAMSSGAILNNKTVSAKNMQPENGGLFDPLMTGGAQGTKYSHIPLFEPMPNPVFEEPIRRLLGLTQSAFQEKLKTGGGTFFKKELAKIDVPARITKLREEMKKASGATLNDMVKQVKALQALQSQGLAPQDAYVISHTPVVPPMFRPILPMPNDPKQLMVADANKLYAHLIDANTVLKSTVLESDRPKHREHLYNAVGALFGTHEVADDELRGQKVKGFLTAISGQGSPKGGFFQRKIMRRTQDVSGRGTAVPDVNLNMDQVGLPEDMLWQMYDRFIIARLIRNGYPALLARDMVTKRHPAARDSMLQECKERPVYINRAPTLHRYSIVSAFPQPVQGKTIRVNPFIEQGMNLDYDGDALQVHAPVTAGGVTDSHKMLLSNQLMSDQTRDKLIAYPQHEAILGVIFASQSEASKSKKSHTFDTHQDLLTAWRKGDVGLNDKVTLTSPMTKKAEFEEAPEYIHEDLGDFPYHWMVLGPQDE